MNKFMISNKQNIYICMRDYRYVTCDGVGSIYVVLSSKNLALSIFLMTGVDWCRVNTDTLCHYIRT